METFEKQWYVLHTYSGYENKVKANIESRAQSMRMGDYIFRVVVPEEKETEVKNGKEKEIVHKTFPGYVLVEMVMTDESWYIVRNTPGVTGFVGSHGAGILRQLGIPCVLRIENATKLIANGEQIEICGEKNCIICSKSNLLYNNCEKPFGHLYKSF